ncbi:MAG: hypothetical protein KJO69_08335 [Gammaproteobacteria bacterium]|nr:hypothetical protein [Gammaproteobacteria bacterium]
MDSKRRDFLRNLGAKTAVAAAAVATPAMDYAASFKEELGRVSDEFQQKLSSTTADLGDRITHLGNRVDAAAINLTYQQAQLNLIFLLLVISFAIDGGMSLAWLLLP